MDLDPVHDRQVLVRRAAADRDAGCRTRSWPATPGSVCSVRKTLSAAPATAMTVDRAHRHLGRGLGVGRAVGDDLDLLLEALRLRSAARRLPWPRPGARTRTARLTDEPGRRRRRAAQTEACQNSGRRRHAHIDPGRAVTSSCVSVPAGDMTRIGPHCPASRTSSSTVHGRSGAAPEAAAPSRRVATASETTRRTPRRGGHPSILTARDVRQTVATKSIRAAPMPRPSDARAPLDRAPSRSSHGRLGGLAGGSCGRAEPRGHGRPRSARRPAERRARNGDAGSRRPISRSRPSARSQVDATSPAGRRGRRRRRRWSAPAPSQA